MSNITHHPSGVSYCEDCHTKLILMDDDVHDCKHIDTDEMTPDEVHATYIGSEGHYRCYSYAYDGDEAAWFALAGHYIMLASNGSEGDERDSIDSFMSMAANDSGDLLELIANNWDDIPQEMRDVLAADLSGFVIEHFDYLVAPDQLAEMVDGYLAAGLWSTYMPTDEPGGYEGGPMDDCYTIDQCVNRWDAENDCKNFVALAWQHLPRSYRADTDKATWSQIGHDFLLTRDHHGTGFWDRGTDYWSAHSGRMLTEVSHTFGDSQFAPDDDDWFQVAQ